MTRYRKDPDAISNHFDELFRDIGHRGSSFMNIDGFVHDGKKKRFLLLEFKWPEEKLDQAAEWAMTDFATIPNCLAMAIRILGDDNYRVKFFPTKIIQEMNGRTLRHILADWWNQ